MQEAARSWETQNVFSSPPEGTPLSITSMFRLLTSRTVREARAFFKVTEWVVICHSGRETLVPLGFLQAGDEGGAGNSLLDSVGVGRMGTRMGAAHCLQTLQAAGLSWLGADWLEGRGSAGTQPLSLCHHQEMVGFRSRGDATGPPLPARASLVPLNLVGGPGPPCSPERTHEALIDPGACGQ